MLVVTTLMGPTRLSIWRVVPEGSVQNMRQPVAVGLFTSSFVVAKRILLASVSLSKRLPLIAKQNTDSNCFLTAPLTQHCLAFNTFVTHLEESAAQSSWSLQHSAQHAGEGLDGYTFHCCCQLLERSRDGAAD